MEQNNMSKQKKSVKANVMYKTLTLLFLAISIGFAANFKPNSKAGIVSVSIDETSMQKLVSVYENAGYFDFGAVQALREADIDHVKVNEIRRLYFHDFLLNVENDELSVTIKGDINAKTTAYSIFHPHVMKNNASAKADMVFRDFGVSDDGSIDLSVCLFNVAADIGDAAYGYGILDDLIGEKIVEPRVKSELQAKLKEKANLYNCIELTKYIGLGYPDFLNPVAVEHPRVQTKNDEISVYGCPVIKTTQNNVVVVNDSPCGTVGYNVAIYTANDISNSGTNSNITLELCGDDYSGQNTCLEKIEIKNGLSGNEFARNIPIIETADVLVNNLSLALNSDNTGRGPGWYVDSVTVNMTLPNMKTFHYWFPIHRWIGGDSPTSYTFKQNDNLQVYTFTVETGDGKHFEHAGTNSYIVADACDINNKCVLFNLDKDEHDDFESGSISTYSIITNEKLSNLKSLTLHNISNGEHSGWYVQDVMYKHYSFPENIDHTLKDGQGFMFRQWLAEGETKDTYYRHYEFYWPDRIGQVTYDPVNSSTILPIEEIYATRFVEDNFGYDVEIKTRDGGSSGTNASILLTIEGCSGKKITFDLDDDVDNFEKGDLDYFRLSENSDNNDLKGIKKVTIYNNGGGDGPGWNPEYIKIVPIRYQGVNRLSYGINVETGLEFGVPYKPFYHSFESNASIGAKATWESPENLSCLDTKIPTLNPYVYEVHPGETVVISGTNLDMAENITMNLDKVLNPTLKTSEIVVFEIPQETALGNYDLGSMIIDGVVQTVFIHVLAEKPILDGIAIVTAKPGDAFEASMRNVSASAKFYLGEHQLTLLAMFAKGVYLQIPKNIENGIYQFRTVSNGWDITFDETIQIIKSVVPHVTSISENLVYTGQIVHIFGKNFGDDLNSITVTVGDKQAVIKSLENEKITIQIPVGVSGKDIPVTVVREDVPAPETLTIEIKGLPWFMSFDDVEHPWTSDNAELTYDETIKEGDEGYSLKIHGDGYKTIVSPKFNTYELGAVSNELLFDIWIPETQTNPYWWGDAQMSVNIPAAGLYNAWVGQVLLTGLQPGWNTLTFKLSDDIYNALAGDYPNATLVIILNANQNPEDFRIDNLRFGGDVKIRTTEHVVASEILNNYSTDFMSFDNVNDWTLSGQELLFVESPKTQGLGATGVVASGYNEIKSRSFTPSELKYVSSVVSLDIYVPNPQPNEYWVGSVGLGLNCPDRGIYSMNLGSADLTYMFREEFNNVQFTLPNEALAALRYGVGECSFSIYLNVNNGAGTFLLDNMGFVQIIEVAGR